MYLPFKGKIHLLFISCWDISSKSLWKSSYKLIHIVTSFSKALHYIKTNGGGGLHFNVLKVSLCIHNMYFPILFILTFYFFLKVLLYFSILTGPTLTKALLRVGETFVKSITSLKSLAILHSPSDPARTQDTKSLTKWRKKINVTKIFNHHNTSHFCSISHHLTVFLPHQTTIRMI